MGANPAAPPLPRTTQNPVTHVLPDHHIERIVITRQHTGDGTVSLSVRGEIDIDNAQQLRVAIHQALAEPRTRQLTVDLADLSYIDSTGVSALVGGLNLARQRRAQFRVTNPHGSVLRVLTVLGLTETLASEA